nr:hypothetical protein BaRGS_007447 [Batillaria attramentaria]
MYVCALALFVYNTQFAEQVRQTVILEDQMIEAEPARLAGLAFRLAGLIREAGGQIKQAIESDVTVVDVKRLTLKDGEKSRAVRVTLAETTLPDHLVINRQEYGLRPYVAEGAHSTAYRGCPAVKQWSLANRLRAQDYMPRAQAMHEAGKIAAQRKAQSTAPPPAATNKALPHLDGYYYPPAVDMEKGRVMVATYVSTRLSYVDADPMTQVNPSTPGDCRLNLRSLTVSLSGGRELTLVNVYYPDGIPDGSACDWLRNLGTRTADARRTWVVADDFNASHRLWDPDATTAGRMHLANAVLESNLSILNDCSVTRIGQGGQRNSAIDITLASPALCLEATWETGDDNMQSDHLPIHITLDQAVPAEEEVNSDPKYAYDKADWEKFRTLLEAECEHLNRNSPDQDVDSKNEEIRSMILTAANAAIPQSRPQPSGGGRLIGEMREYRRTEEQRFEKSENDGQAPSNGDLTLEELRTAIGSLGSQGKATGHDPISYQMIRHFPDRMIKVLLGFYQTCWDSGQIPKAWKKAVVVAIHKDGKPPHLPTSYRPVALTSHLGKVYERLARDRLEYHLEKHGIIPLCQAGFRKGRGCMKHVARLTSEIKKAMVNKHSMVTTFFDIKRAFDTVWHAKLLDKLSRIGISGRLYQFVQAFLADRRISGYMGLNGFQLSPEKTSLVVFSRTNGAKNAMSIKIGNVTIKPCSEAKFLGVTLNERLRWQPHISNLTAKAARSVNLIKILSAGRWATPRSLIHLTNALVRSRLTYGCEAFFALSKAEFLKLERVELAALKTAIGARKGARNDLVYQEAGWLPLREECKRRCANFQAAMHATETTLGDKLTETVTKETLIRQGSGSQSATNISDDYPDGGAHK